MGRKPKRRTVSSDRESVSKERPGGTPWGEERSKTITRTEIQIRAFNWPRGRASANEPPNSRWAKGRGYPTSFVFDAAQYITICEIANDEHLTRKELVYRLLQEGLKKYYSGELDMG